MSYLEIAKAALLPSLLYYLALLAMIHFEAVNKNIGRLPEEQIPSTRSVMIRMYYLLPWWCWWPSCSWAAAWFPARSSAS